MIANNIYALHSLQYNNNIDYIIHTPSLLQYEIMYLVLSILYSNRNNTWMYTSARPPSGMSGLNGLRSRFRFLGIWVFSNCVINIRSTVNVCSKTNF